MISCHYLSYTYIYISLGVKLLIHQSELAKVIPCKEQSSFHFVVHVL